MAVLGQITCIFKDIFASFCLILKATILSVRLRHCVIVKYDHFQPRVMEDVAIHLGYLSINVPLQSGNCVIYVITGICVICVITGIEICDLLKEDSAVFLRNATS